MTSTDDDRPLPELDPRMAEFMGDVGHQPVPPRLKRLAEQLRKALDEARKRRDH